MTIKNQKSLGIILWQGKSLLDGERIAAVATGVYSKSKNGKTGEMIQTYIIRRDINPVLARRLGYDYSICGDCMHREHSTCYVNLGQGPLAVFNALVDGRYKTFENSDIELFKDREIRFGSYGDPAAIPYSVWENIAMVAKNVTGYTHQWHNKKTDSRLKNFCMASVDTITGFYKEYDKAQKMGWRTFRVRESLENPLMDNEFVCPASKEGGTLVQCENCLACGGFSSKTKKSVSIVLHADSDALGNWRNKLYVKIMKRRKAKHSWRKDYVYINKKIKEFLKTAG